jgi:hypothetical protein
MFLVVEVRMELQQPEMLQMKSDHLFTDGQTAVMLLSIQLQQQRD